MQKDISHDTDNREIEAKIKITGKLARHLLLDLSGNELVLALFADGLISDVFDYRLVRQPTSYFDTKATLFEQNQLTYRRRMHSENGLIVEGMKSLVETKNIQDRYEREVRRTDIYEQARAFVTMGGAQENARKLNAIWEGMAKILWPKLDRKRDATTKVRKQIMQLLQIFDPEAPDNVRTADFVHPYLCQFQDDKLRVKKALSRALIPVLPIQQEKLDYCMSGDGMPEDVQKKFRGIASDIKSVGSDEIARCFYTLLYNGHEYELAVDGGLSQGGRWPISEVEIEVKPHKGEVPPGKDDLTFLKDKVGAYITELEMKLGTRHESDWEIKASPSKGACSAMVRRGAHDLSMRSNDKRHGILQPSNPKPCKVLQEILNHYGP